MVARCIVPKGLVRVFCPRCGKYDATTRRPVFPKKECTHFICLSCGELFYRENKDLATLKYAPGSDHLTVTATLRLELR